MLLMTGWGGVEEHSQLWSRVIAKLIQQSCSQNTPSANEAEQPEQCCRRGRFKDGGQIDAACIGLKLSDNNSKQANVPVVILITKLGLFPCYVL